jgi:C4-dicarboxylate-specific signal transduction histidine kinase
LLARCFFATLSASGDVTSIVSGGPPHRTGPVVKVGVAVLSTAVALLITRSLDLSVFPTPLFFAAVVNSTWFGGVKSGLLTVGLAALTLDYYFIPARESFVMALPHLLQFVLPALLTLWFVQKRKVAEFSLRAARDESRAKVRERTNQLRIESAEREKAEQTVHRTQAQLAHVNRVMTMGELATSIAHELNQPLMAVAVNGDACLQWLNGPNPNLEEARAAVARMVAESGRAGEIIKRIRALSQNSSPRKERVDLHAVLEETLALTNGELVANRVAVVTDLATNLPGVWGDRVQLQQVILNLIINAVEAMNESNESARRLHISTGLHGTNAVVIGIRDFGPGIGADQADHIFDAFITTKPHGVGMGLSISRTIIEAHAGRLWYEAARPGAIFRFTLPTEEPA